MNDARKRAQAGFTILEALISSTIFLVILVAVLATYTPSKKVYARGESKTDVQANARLALGEMSRQIRMAGYFPENFTIPAPGTALTGGIRLATDSALAIYGDANAAGASNVYLFCLEGTTLRRTQGAVGSSSTYICSNGTVLAENVMDVNFVYYDEDGNPVPDPPAGTYALDGQATGSVPSMTTTTQRGAVRRVLVALTTQLDAPGGRGPHVYTVTSNMWLRNIQ
jgi:type II secretory pathway pseudopilin PulG